MSVEEGGGDLDDSWSLGSRSSSSIAGSAANDEKQGANGPPSADSNNDAMIYEKEKTARILAACRAGSIEDLQELAMSKGGFLSDANRALAWPILLGSIDSWGGTDLDGVVNPVPGAAAAATATTTTSSAEDRGGGAQEDWRNLPRHRDEDQVKLDVDRSFVYYPNDNSQAELDAKKAELSDLITEVLRRQPHLCYFQGYHDICQVLLLVLPATSSLAVAKEKGGAVPVPTPPTPVGLRASTAARLSGLRIRDFMLPSLGPAVTQLRLIPEILARADAALCARLARTEPYFALPDTLTMFAHNVRRLPDIARVFDALLAREPAFALYLFAALASSRRDRLLAENSPEDEPDMLHFALSKLPQSFDDNNSNNNGEADLDAVIAAAADLASAHPPESLPSWRRSVSRHSALKTARSVRSCARDQTLDDGRAHFDAQLRELRRADRLRALRARYDTWPNRLAVLAVVLGVAAAVYVRHHAGSDGDAAPSWLPLGSLWGYWGV